MNIVTVEVDLIECNGQPVQIGDGKKLIMRAHWCDRDRIIIETPDGMNVQVMARDIVDAIASCSKKTGIF